MRRTTLGSFTLHLWLFGPALLLGGCYAPSLHSTAMSFRPDPVGETEQLLVGRDCSFHLGGLPLRDLSVRQAARHALESTTATTLTNVSSHLVYPVPFEVCLEVQGLAPTSS